MSIETRRRITHPRGYSRFSTIELDGEIAMQIVPKFDSPMFTIMFESEEEVKDLIALLQLSLVKEQS